MLRNLRVLGLAAVVAFAGGVAGTAVAHAQSACDDLGGTVGPDRVCHVISTTAEPVYRYEFTFPADYPDQQAVTDYLTQERDDFVGYVTTLTRPHDIPYELLAKGKAYHSGSPPSGTASLVLELFNESGGAHPVTFYKAFNYDLAKNVPITFDTLFKPGTKPIDIIYPIVARELSKRFGPEKIWDGNDVNTYQNFAITDDAVIFFFSQGQVLAQVDGPIEVSMPRTELAAVLA
jgi:hypothetical protein